MQQQQNLKKKHNIVMYEIYFLNDQTNNKIPILIQYQTIVLLVYELECDIFSSSSSSSSPVFSFFLLQFYFIFHQ